MAQSPPCLLPTPPTSFVGREREIQTCRSLLLSADVRLLTLTGPGGIGKTRLALALAASVADQFRDGVQFIDLAPIDDATMVVSKIGESIGVEDTPNQPLLTSVIDALVGRELVLVLDNFERVVAAGAELGQLLIACPLLKLLVTSRTVLRVYGEHEFSVPSLALPGERTAAVPETLWRYEAPALFMERARAVNRDLQFTGKSANAVAEICTRLDGLPLAIELAAAWVRVMPPPFLLSRLGSRLQILVGGPRNLPSRQQTLRATLDWSYELLEPEERILFRRLGVFVGGCSLEAFEAICGVPDRVAGDMLGGIASLVDKSLVRRHSQEDEPRFGMLETIREYALERLRAHDELEFMQRRHASYYLSVAEQAEPFMYGPEQVTWVERLSRDHENLRAALRWAHEQGEVDMGLRMGTALSRFWRVHGHLGEGQRWLETALARAEGATAGVRARALGRAGMLGLFRGEYELAVERLEQSLHLCRELDDPRGIGYALNYLAGTSVSRGDYAAAGPLYEESLAIFRALKDPWGTRAGLNNLGEVARGLGDHARASALYEESVALSRAAGDRFMEALGLTNLATLAQEQSDVDRAAALAEQSLLLFREQGAITDGLLCLEVLAGVAAARGEPRRATRLFGAAEALLEMAGVVFQENERVAHDRDVARARSALDEATFAAEWTAGFGMSLSEAVDYALATPTMAIAESKRDRNTLTRREREIAILLAQGLTDRQIATQLVITEGTVGIHVDHIYSKLGVHSRARVGAWAAEHGLLPADDAE